MVLVSAAQATHALVPPDVLEPVLRAIANNLVTDRVSNEVMAAGYAKWTIACSKALLHES